MNKENMPPTSCCDDDDFKPLKKKPKTESTLDMQGMFPRSSMNNCTFNINIKKYEVTDM